MRVVIWSGEHRAYWRPVACGYTQELFADGLYMLEEVVRITSHCGPERRIAILDYKAPKRSSGAVLWRKRHKPRTARRGC